MDVDLVLEVFVGGDADDTSIVVLHQGGCRALELEFASVSGGEGVHGVGGVLHLQDVMVQGTVQGSHIHGHFA
jgi:hypothetical protein